MSQKIEMNRASFLTFVRQYVESDPEAAAHIGDAAQAGLRLALNKAYERAADMEVALSVLATKRYKGADAVVRDKLAKWEGKTALRWDWLTHNASLSGPDAALCGRSARSDSCTSGD